MAEMTYPRIFGRRLDGALLVALDARSGCVYDSAARIVYPRLALASLLAQPYWQPYHGRNEELRDWPGPPQAQAPAPTMTLPLQQQSPQQPKKETIDND